LLFLLISPQQQEIGDEIRQPVMAGPAEISASLGYKSQFPAARGSDSLCM